MIRKLAILPFLCAVFLLAPRLATATPVTMAWSPVGNPGNAADGTTGYGAVGYSYSIGTYLVTVSQYVAFLNANDPTGLSPLGLYDPGGPMDGNSGATFNPSAPSGSMYGVKSGDGNLPMDGVTWYDAIRFANWMENGQPIFSTEPTATNNATENGSYTLDGFTQTPSNSNSITRNQGARIVLPSENEWYKAAYYNPATQSYFLYPTSSNTAPTRSTPTSTPNSANYGEVVDGGALPPLSLTPVGAYSGTTSPYGAFDMAGDLREWDETLIGSNRGVRGAYSNDGAGDLESSYRFSGSPTSESYVQGFRLALVPEPGSIALAIAGCVGAFAMRKRLRWSHG